MYGLLIWRIYALNFPCSFTVEFWSKVDQPVDPCQAIGVKQSVSLRQCLLRPLVVQCHYFSELILGPLGIQFSDVQVQEDQCIITWALCPHLCLMAFAAASPDFTKALGPPPGLRQAEVTEQ